MKTLVIGDFNKSTAFCVANQLTVGLTLPKVMKVNTLFSKYLLSLICYTKPKLLVTASLTVPCQLWFL